MRLLEKIFALGIIVGLVMKFALLPGGDFITMIPTLLLASLYYPLGFLFFSQIGLRKVFRREAYKEVTGLRIAYAVVTGIGLSTICVGALFKLLNLPGANAMLMMGVIISIIILVISLIITLKGTDTQGKFILTRVFIVGAIGLALLFVSQLSIVRFQYRNHPAYVDAFEKHSNDPTNTELEKAMRLEYYRIQLSPEEFKRYEEYENR